jgi:ubiquinone/menaquinone biosynthesis C-methylase UbiE
MDIDPAMIEQANPEVERVTWKVGDAHNLAYDQGRFDVVICNFLLLWVQDPVKVVREMTRVVSRGGVVLDTAEPDYGGRIDFPEDLDMGVAIGQALQQSGGDPYIGRKLRKLFVQAGLISEVGIITSLWDQEQMKKEFADEWSFWERLLKKSLSSQEVDHKRKRVEEASRSGWSFTFTPIFYALGRK